MKKQQKKIFLKKKNQWSKSKTWALPNQKSRLEPKLNHPEVNRQRPC